MEGAGGGALEWASSLVEMLACFFLLSGEIAILGGDFLEARAAPPPRGDDSDPVRRLFRSLDPIVSTSSSS